MPYVLSGETREDVAHVLETVARDGLPGPRDLDAALDAIEDRLAADLRQALDVAIRLRDDLAAVRAIWRGVKLGLLFWAVIVSVVWVLCA